MSKRNLMNTMADDRIWTGFIRQRRNLMVASGILAFALVADLSIKQLNIFGNIVEIGKPVAIRTALWVLWGYWLLRYYVYFRDLGDKSFRNKQRFRMRTLMEHFAAKRLMTDPFFSAELHKQLQQVNAKTWEVREVYYAGPLLPGRLAISVNINAITEPEKASWVDLPWKPILEIVGVPLFILNVRAWLYVLANTSLFSEYLLPYLVAAVPAIYYVYCLISDH